MRFIYVASPYRVGDVAANIRRNLVAADAVAALGLIPFAPLLSVFWDIACPRGDEHWLAYGLAWVERCDALLRLPGASTGADAEEARAREFGMPVFYSLEALAAAAPRAPTLAEEAEGASA